jgi:pimeloyl-ACP methyl ester carboxylesterase
MADTACRPRCRLKRRVDTAVMLAAVMMTTTACGSSSTKAAPPSASGSVVVAPIQVAHTSLGNVSYRVVGKGQPLVLVMGYAGTMETWEPQFVDTLARHYRVVVFDNAGLGGTASLPAPLNIDAMADQTAALIASLRLTAPDVLGWSMGSMIAQALAVRHPTDVAKLVLCASWPGTGAAVVPAQTAIDALKSGQPNEVRGVLYPADQAFSYDAYIGALSTYPAAPSASATTITQQDGAITGWWAGTDAGGRNPAGISVPTLIADGASDQLDNVSNSNALAKLIPRATLQLYPDAGHAFLFQEGTPFAFLVESFLSGPPAPAPAATISSVFQTGETNVAAATRTSKAAFSALPSNPTSAQLAAIEAAYAGAITTFDDQLLNLGTSGNVDDAVKAFVAVNEKLGTDGLALPAQSQSTVASWTARATADNEEVQTATAALRNALGLPAASQSP